MSQSISRQTAQKIVDTVKDVCNYNINFINTKGIIFASTDSSRIGSFHEIGKKVIDTKETIEVDADNSFFGTHKGVNIPFTYNREVIAAIGISGNPNEVRQYAILAQRITSLILREQEIDLFNYNQQNLKNYIIRSLIEGNDIDFDQLTEFLSDMNLNINWNYRVILVQLNTGYNFSNLSMIENHIYNTFDQIKAPLYTFNYPNKYVLLLPENQYPKWSYVFQTLAENYHQILSVGIGSCCTIWKQVDSYNAAQIAINSLSNGKNYSAFDELKLETLLGCVTESVKEEYLLKTIASLDYEDLELLQAYFEHDMSLKDTSEKLFLHKNTLQYKLNRIEKLTSLNPRRFRDAVALYLALKLS